MKLSEATDQRLHLRWFDCYYTIDDHGREQAIVHLDCRDVDGNPHHIEVEGFTPYFCVPRLFVDDATLAALQSDVRVTNVVEGDMGVVPYEWRVELPMDTDGEWARTPLLRIETQLPSHVRDLRDEFYHTSEADVLYSTRFLVDMELYSTFTVPSEATERRITPDEIQPTDPENVAVGDVRPRIIYFDIEVQTSHDGPAVVSEDGTAQARNSITAISAYDSYDDAQKTWVLENEDWDEHPTVDGVTIYEDEKQLLRSWCQYLADRKPDVLTGWNSSGFDVPYFVNRCFNLDISKVKSISPTRGVSRMHGEGRWLNGDLDGVICFDLLEGYKNVQRRGLESYSLANVAANEGLSEKLDVNEQEAYVDAPKKFCEYVKRDTELLVLLNEKREIL